MSKVILGYVANSRAAWDTQDLASKKDKPPRGRPGFTAYVLSVKTMYSLSKVSLFRAVWV